MSKANRRTPQAHARLWAAIAVRLLCSVGVLFALDPAAFSAAPAEAVPCSVSNTNDSGAGSLRAALNGCEASGGTVIFQAGLTAQTIVLTTTEIAVT